MRGRRGCAASEKYGKRNKMAAHETRRYFS
jgi:hypothetical protein